MMKKREFNLLITPGEIKKLTTLAKTHLPPLGFEENLKFERVGEGTFDEVKIGAVAQGPQHTLVINIDWYETTDEQDIKYIIWHEMRHLYQWSQIEKMHRNIPLNESEKIIQKWEYEMLRYTPNTPATEEKHMKQEMEIDAYTFALYMLFKYCADNNGTVNIGLPPMIEDELMTRVKYKLFMDEYKF